MLLIETYIALTAALFAADTATIAGGGGVTPPAAAAVEPARAPAGGPSDVPRAAAQAALAEGNRLFKKGDFTAALVEYRRAQAIHPETAAKVEFNIGKSEQALGHTELAAQAFERFLAQPLQAPAGYREEASTTLVRIASGLGKVRVVGKDGLTVLVDGSARGSTPLGGELWLRVGPHLIVIEDGGGRSVAQHEIEVRVGDTTEVNISVSEAARTAPAALPAAPPQKAPEASAVTIVRTPGETAGAGAADERRPLWTKWWFWAAAGTVVAAGTLAVVLSSRSDPVVCGGVYDMNCKLTPIP